MVTRMTMRMRTTKTKAMRIFPSIICGDRMMKLLQSQHLRFQTLPPTTASNKLLTAAHDQFHDRDRAVQIAAGGRVINVLLQNRPPRRLVTDDPIPSAPVRPVAMAGPDHGRTHARGHDPARDLLDPIDATRTGDVEASRVVLAVLQSKAQY